MAAALILKEVAGLTWRYIPHIVNSDRKLIDFIEKIMPTVRPGWKKGDVCIKEVNTGLGVTNELIGFCTKNSTQEDFVLLRVNGKGTENFINREREIYLKCFLSQAKLAPPLYCEFENGLCYGYVPGEPLQLEKLRDSDVQQSIAKSIALLHSYTIPHVLCGKETTALALMDALYAMILGDDQQSNRVKEVYLSKECIGQEVADMKKVVMQFDSLPVLCHNDLQSGNILISEEQKISFIDFEYSGLNHWACDIGNFFSEFAGLDQPDYSLYPDETEQKKFIRLYLDEMSKLKGIGFVTDEDINKYYIEVNQGAAVMNLVWVLWSIVQVHLHEDSSQTDDFDYIEYSIARYRHYKELKAKFCLL